MHHAIRRSLALAAVSLVLLVSCADDPASQDVSAGQATPPAPASAPSPAPASPGDASRDETNDGGQAGALAAVLPDLELERVATGQQVPIRSLVDGEQPMLVWFWAPHCPRCNREIPSLEAFAAANPGLQVLGLGTQDSAAEAADFRARHDVEAVELLWDSGYASWQHFGVQAQPYGILYSPAGAELDRWTGEVDLDQLADAL